MRRRVRESDNVFRGEPGSGKHEDPVYGRRGWCPRKRVEKMHRGTRRAVRSVRRENEEVNRRRELDDQVRRRRRVGGLLSFTLLSFTLLAKRARVAFVLLRDKKKFYLAYVYTLFENKFPSKPPTPLPFLLLLLLSSSPTLASSYPKKSSSSSSNDTLALFTFTIVLSLS